MCACRKLRSSASDEVKVQADGLSSKVLTTTDHHSGVFCSGHGLHAQVACMACCNQVPKYRALARSPIQPPPGGSPGAPPIPIPQQVPGYFYQPTPGRHFNKGKKFGVLESSKVSCTGRYLDRYVEVRNIQVLRTMCSRKKRSWQPGILPGREEVCGQYSVGWPLAADAWHPRERRLTDELCFSFSPIPPPSPPSYLYSIY